MGIAEGLRGAVVYDLARPLEAATPTSPNHPPFRMALQRRHGDVVRQDGGSAASEMFVMGGHTGTHIDAVCHVSHNGALHGGIDAQSAVAGGRFASLGIDTLPPLVCRGVVLDAAAAIGRPHLAESLPITRGIIEEACARQGVTIAAGDAVLIRTGWGVGRYDDAAAFVGHDSGVPGIDETAAEWFADLAVAAVGGDTIALEYLPPGKGHAHLPVHRILLVEHGIPILELLDLEEIVATKVHEFVFVAAPIKIVGATGSPIRPLAINGAFSR